MNAPKIDIKEILAKLSVLKNNLSLLVPIIIAVVALLLVIPTRMLSARLRDMIDKTSVSAGKEIDRLVDDLAPDKIKNLSEKYLAAANQDANEFDKLMDQMVKRELLSYELFPDTNDQSRELFAQFGQRYREGVTTMLQGLHPGECPSFAEIQAAMASTAQGLEAGGRGAYGGMPGMGAGGGGGMYGGGMLSFENMTEAQRKILDQVCRDKAANAKVYATLTDVAGYTYWGNWTFEDRDKAYRDCWYWQLGYWVVEDVLNTIQQMNAPSQNALEAPVKRIMNLGFTFRRAMMPGTRSAYPGANRAEGERPVYVTQPYKGLAMPLTGRICNESGDVVHFNVQVVIEAAQLLPFVQTLCSAKEHRFRGDKGQDPEQKYKHNQITVLETVVRPIEPRDNNHTLYRYGDRPVVELELICEYLFNRTPAYDGLKPKVALDDLKPVTEQK
jgi:hypothetical protein